MAVRVLHVFYGLNRGGRESRTMDLYRRLDRSRVQFDFYVESGREGAFSGEVRELGGRIFYPAVRGLGSCLPNFLSFSSFLGRHPEYRTVCAYNQWSGLYLRQAQRRGVPHRIAWAANAFQTPTLKNAVKNLVKRSVNRYATHRLAVSRRAGTWLFGPEPFTVWPNAIDAGACAFSEGVRREVREELGLGDALAVMHVGNIRRQKNHPFLIEVFERIARRRPDARLVLAGGGGFAGLEPLIRRKGLGEKVRYLGVRGDVPRLLQAGDVFVFPSFHEGFPGAVLEAEASGLPCVVSDAVTDEVEVTGRVCRIPLSAGAEYWAERALGVEPGRREDAWREVAAAGYDVEDLAARAERFFEGLE